MKDAHTRPPGPKFRLLGPSSLRNIRHPVEFMHRTAKEYGDIAYLRFGPVRLYVVTRAEYVKEVLVTRYAALEKGAAFHMAKSILGEGLLTSDGDFHLRQRRLCQPAFHKQRLESYASAMTQSAARVRDEWTDGEPVDVFKEMSRLTLTIAARALFGFDIEHVEAGGVREALTKVLDGWRFSGLPLARLMHRLRLPVPGSGKLRRARKELDDIIYRIIDQRRAAGSVSDDFLSALVHAVDDEGDGKSMTNLQLRDEAMTFILAGHETIATTLTWTWYLLSQHPEVESRLFEEIDHVVGDRPPTVESVGRLEYAWKVLAETMRLYPAFWAFSRRTTEDIDLGPYTLPAGCQIVLSPYVTQRRADYFPDPDRFDPERFTPDRQAERPEMSYFPFGAGVRRCIGEAFAWQEGLLVLATVAQKYRLELVPGHDVQFGRAFILRPKHGMLMTPHRREQSVRHPAAGEQTVG